MHEGKRKKRDRRSRRGSGSSGKQVAVEEPFILRVPPEEEDIVRNLLKEGRADTISLTFDGARKARLSIEGREYRAELVDLPCIVEAHKTYNRQIYYKVADVGQMVVAARHETQLEHDKVPIDARMVRRDPDIAYQWKHGLTGPFWNVRERRFRRRAPRRMMDDVESEVRRLLMADSNASEVKIKFFDEEREEIGDEEMENARRSGEQMVEKESDLDEEGFTMLADLERDLVEPSQEKGEGGEEEEGEEGIEGEEEEEEEEEEIEEEERLDEEADEESTTDEEESTKEDLSSIMQRRANALKEKKLLEETIRDLEEKIERKRAQMRMIPNLLLRKRFEDSINEMKAELESQRARLVQIQEEVLG
jgi:transcription initiation factor TFIID subunit 7